LIASHEVPRYTGRRVRVPYLTMGPYVAMGVVEERYGACTITAQRFERADEP